MEEGGDEKAQFMSITGATAIEAQFYLDSSGGDVQNAIDTFFSQNEHGGRKEIVRRQQERQVQGDSDAGRRFQSNLPRNEGPRIATLGGQRQPSQTRGANEYYAGGEKSGQVVRANDDDEDEEEEEDDEQDRVGSLMRTAMRHGAEHSTRPVGGEQRRQGLQAFTGTGRTLAGDEHVHTEAAPEEPEVAQCVITFYRNNVFTVNDGPPRNITDPDNHHFVQMLVKGFLPEEVKRLEARVFSLND